MKVKGVSYSSDKKLARCEKQYSYRYDEKLKAKVKKRGLYIGDWMHQLTEAFRRDQDWKKKWKELKKTLWDSLFDEEKEMYGDVPSLSYELMEHYIEHWEDDHKKWKPLHIEEAYEKMTKYGWPVRWKSDYIVKEGKLTVLVENKNNKEIPDSGERILAPQVHAYCWLLLKVKGIKIDVIVWDYVRTEPVLMPKINKDGTVSKRKINTDQRTFRKALREAKIQPDSGEEWLSIKEKLDALPETLSLMRIRNAPNFKVGELFVRQWIERARRAEKIVNPLRNWGRTCSWDCDYYNLCQAEMLGKDTSVMRKKDFIQIEVKPEEELGGRNAIGRVQ